MKHLFNNISQGEKQRILEMHKGSKMVFSEQVATTPQTSQPQQKGEIWVNNYQIFDGVNWADPKKDANAALILSRINNWFTEEGKKKVDLFREIKNMQSGTNKIKIMDIDGSMKDMSFTFRNPQNMAKSNQQPNQNRI